MVKRYEDDCVFLSTVADVADGGGGCAIAIEELRPREISKIDSEKCGKDILICQNRGVIA